MTPMIRTSAQGKVLFTPHDLIPQHEAHIREVASHVAGEESAVPRVDDRAREKREGRQENRAEKRDDRQEKRDARREER